METIEDTSEWRFGNSSISSSEFLRDVFGIEVTPLLRSLSLAYFRQMTRSISHLSAVN